MIAIHHEVYYFLKIPFDKDISTAEWGKLCDRINFSEEFKNFSNSDDIKNTFRKIMFN